MSTWAITENNQANTQVDPGSAGYHGNLVGVHESHLSDIHSLIKRARITVINSGN